jgi:hypothetical protein
MPGGNPFECLTQTGKKRAITGLFFVCEKMRTFFCVPFHERPPQKSASFEAELFIY